MGELHARIPVETSVNVWRRNVVVVRPDTAFSSARPLKHYWCWQRMAFVSEGALEDQLVTRQNGKPFGTRF